MRWNPDNPLADCRPITGAMPGSILIEPDFLSRWECRTLVECSQRNQELAPQAYNGDVFFDNRVLWFASLPDSEAAARSIIQRARFAATQRIQIFFELHEALYSDSVQLVRWPPGRMMPPHSDNSHTDGKLHESRHREYASIVYLNDDFLGGHLFFPIQRAFYAPRQGQLVAFPAGVSHLHGVTDVAVGTRYTMAAWYTRDIRHRDPGELVPV